MNISALAELGNEMGIQGAGLYKIDDSTDDQRIGSEYFLSNKVYELFQWISLGKKHEFPIFAG